MISQSMFDKETHTLTANGKYVDWTVQKDVSTFTKKEYLFSISYNLVVRLIAGVSYEYNIII